MNELTCTNINNMDIEHVSCGSETSTKCDRYSCPRSDDMSPAESTVTCSPYRRVCSSSDSEDDLPSCGVKWSPNLRKVQSSIEGQRVNLNINEILAKRKKDEAFFAQMDKLDDLLNEKIELNDKPDDLNPMNSEDEDFKFILEKAKEMSVDEPTLNDEKCYAIMKPEFSLTIFSAETLEQHFVKSFITEKRPNVACSRFDSLFSFVSSLSVDTLCEYDEEELCTFIFYVMSVHPSNLMVDQCHSFLRLKSDFYPCLTDFINVFQNWGCRLHDLYVTVPNIYTGLQSSIMNIKPNNVEIKEHNLTSVFGYLEYVVKMSCPGTLCDIIEPLLRLYFDVKSFNSKVRGSITTSVLLLMQFMNCSPMSVLIKKIHIRDLSLIHQTEICTGIFAATRFGLPLGYAILQQSLGCLNIIYCQHVDLRAVYTLLAEKKNIIETSTSEDIYCYLQIIKMFLCCKELIDGKVHTQQIDQDNWHDLVHSWSLLIARGGHSGNAMIVKEDIAKLQYVLRMKQAVQTRQHFDISLHKGILGNNL